jgi:hypothetical protein
MDRALTALRDQGYSVSDEDAARLSPFVRAHIAIDGHYSFHLPDLGEPTDHCATRRQRTRTDEACSGQATNARMSCPVRPEAGLHHASCVWQIDGTVVRDALSP